MHKINSGVLVPDAGEQLRWDLQLFAGEGASSSGDGGDGSSSTGVQSADAGQNGTMDNLGIPKDKLERYRASKARRAPEVKAPEPSEPAVEQDAAASEPEEPSGTESTVDWDEALKSPEFKAKVQDIVSKRVKSYDGRMEKIAPILEILGQKYGMDVSDMSRLDVDALAKKVAGDESFFEAKAEEMGASPETAKRVFQAELSEQRKLLEEKDRSMRAHFENLQRQADELTQKIPGFSLAEELRDRRFMAMVSPEIGLTVEEAYNAVHHDEIIAQRDAMAASAAKRAAANSVMAGKTMPAENGAVARSAAEVTPKFYSQMSPEERKVWINSMKAKGRTGRMG